MDSFDMEEVHEEKVEWNDDIEVDGRETQYRKDLLKKFANKDESMKIFSVRVINNKRIADMTFKHVAIEFKKMGDFIGDVKGGQLFEKVKRMKRHYKDVYVSVTYEYKKGDTPFDECRYMHLSDYGKNMHFVYGAINTIAQRYGVTVLFYETEEDQMWAAINLCSKALKGPANPNVIGSKASVKTGSVGADMITKIDGVGIAKIPIIAEKFPTVADLAEANIEQIKELDSFGPKLSQNVYNAFHDKLINAVIKKRLKKIKK